MSKEEKKRQRGSNKGRRWGKIHEEVNLCWRFAGEGTCEFGDKCVVCQFFKLFFINHLPRCRYSHDIGAYLAAKPKDIYFPTASDLSEQPPYVGTPPIADEHSFSTINSTIRCPVYETTGSCRYGLKCRFLSGHIQRNEDGTFTVLEDSEKKAATADATSELNFLPADALKLLRKKKVCQHIGRSSL
jgi:tRNA-dihydrouridine synthase 3